MYRIIFFLLIITTVGYSQKHGRTIKQADSTSVETIFKPYISLAVALSNTDKTSNGSLQYIEMGVAKKNIGLGLSLGRNSFVYNTDNINNYYIEPKITGSLPFGFLTGTLIFGVGKYFNTSGNFIEYGSGLIYTNGQISYGITYSNFNKTDFISPSITYTFN